MNRKIKFSLPLIILTVSGMVQAQSQAPQTPNKAAATIAGRVTLDGAGAPGAHVMIKPQVNESIVGISISGELSPSPSAITDSEGRYRLTDVAPGSYRVSVFAPVYVIEGEKEQPATGKTVNIADGDNVENVDFTLARGAVITGKVTDDKERPVIAAPITVYSLNVYGGPRTPTVPYSRYVRWETDDQGVYRIFGLESGRYMVAVGANSPSMSSSVNGYRHTYHPDAIDDAQAKVVEVKSAEEASNIDIKVASSVKSYSVTGRVVDAESGDPVPGVLVTCTGGSGFRTGRPVTNALGEFRFENMTPDSYRAFIVNGAREKGGPTSLGDEIKFEVVDSDVSGLEIKTPRLATISGVVSIEGSNNPSLRAKLAQVSLFVQSRAGMMVSRSPGGNGTISPNGTFKLSNVQPGRTFILTGFDDAKGFTLARIEYNGIEVREFNVNAGEQITGVRLIFAYGNGVIAGHVEVKGGSLPAGTQMRTHYRRESDRQNMELPKISEVDARGQFLIEGLTQGTYKLYLLIFGYGEKSGFLPPKVEQNVTVTGEGRYDVTLIVDLSPKEKDK